MVEIARLEKDDTKPIELSENDFALYTALQELADAIKYLARSMKK